MKQFVHLHNHSEYSLLDGFSRINEMVERAATLGQPALALTDHGNLYAAVEFFKAAQKSGIKPIIGVEAYVTTGSRFDKTNTEKFPSHITLLAQNETGYLNLLQAVSKSHRQSFYYRPRMDHELLAEHSEGVILLSGCPSSNLSQFAARDDRQEQALELIGWYKEVFGSRFYIELMRHAGVPNQDTILKNLVAWAKTTDTPMVITNDNHYVLQEQHKLQDVLTCIQTNSKINDPNRLHMEDTSFYIRSAEEMHDEWGEELPEALANTLQLAETVEFEMRFGESILPRYTPPNGMSSMDYLRKISHDGLHLRYGDQPSQALCERLDYELSVVEATNFADYFLVCNDLFKFVNEREILSAVRGSAASSLILYCLKVTQIDPIQNGLVFERFLNIERREMPDIDMDFQDDRRSEVIQYCANTYGEDHVAQIISFGTLGAKAALRDVNRALGYSVGLGDKLARLVPYSLGMTIKKAIAESPEFQGFLNKSEEAREVVQIAQGLEGSVRHTTTHAAGVVICGEPLTKYVPLQLPTDKSDNAPPTTQYSMDPIADIGLLKMDFLGLRNLTVIAQTLNMVSVASGTKMKAADIPTDDENTFKMLSKGDTYGVFQLEGDGMQRNITKLRPNSVADISAMIALYRPGPMQHIDQFVAAKHGRKTISYMHPDLVPILEETYGVIVYQDQILLIARKFGGYTLGQADVLRKAMGKKIPEIMAKERMNFVNGAVASGYTEALAERLFELIEPFAGYAFNKAHSVSYAMIAYWTAYLKRQHPVEYFAALLESYRRDQNRLTKCIWETRNSKVQLLGPDINESDIKFSVAEQPDGTRAIRFGFMAIKGVGENSIRPILEARNKGGRFESLEDFCTRAASANLTRAVLETFIKVGVFDSFGVRGAMLGVIDQIAGAIQRANADGTDQGSLFDMLDPSLKENLFKITLHETEVSLEEKLSWERELLGIEITEVQHLHKILENQARFAVTERDVREHSHGKRLRLLGVIDTLHKRTTTRKEDFLVVSVRLIDGVIEAIVWPDVLGATRNYWQPGRYLVMDGVVSESNDGKSFHVRSVEDFSLADTNTAQNGDTTPHNTESPTGSRPSISNRAAEPNHHYVGDNEPHGIELELINTEDWQAARDTLENVLAVLLRFTGDKPVILSVNVAGQEHRLTFPFIKVDPSELLQQQLSEIIGHAYIRVLV